MSDKVKMCFVTNTLKNKMGLTMDMIFSSDEYI